MMQNLQQLSDQSKIGLKARARRDGNFPSGFRLCKVCTLKCAGLGTWRQAAKKNCQSVAERKIHEIEVTKAHKINCKSYRTTGNQVCKLPNL
jgi:hypothetical protein